MGQNVIDLGYDMDKITPQQKVMVEYLSRVLELAEQIDGRKIAPDIGGQTELNNAFGKQKKVIDDLTLSTSEYNKILSGVAIAQAKQAAASSDAAQQLATEKEALRQRNAEVKNQAIVNAAAQGSIDQMKAALAQLTSQYDKMGAAQRSSASGKELQANIKAQSDALFKLESETGRYSRNVGNYTGAITILQKSLTDVKQKIDDFTSSGNMNQEVLAKLQTEQELLTQVLQQNNKGFSSLTMEVRANERALATMYEQGLQSTEAFNQLQASTSKAKRELRQFSENEKLLSSAAPGLSAATVAAKGLAGMYAVGAGATALFANGNEKVEKELNKLVAIMTVLQGLNEVHELMQKRLAVAKIFDAAGTGLQTAALKVYTYFTEAATFATKAFRAALISTGLGALIILLSSFTSSMSSASDETKKGAESLRDYGKAIDDINEDLEMANKTIEANADRSKEQVKQRAGSEKEVAKITQKALLDQIAAKRDANFKLLALQDDLYNDRAKLAGKDDKESEEKRKEIDKKIQDTLKEQNKNVFAILDDGIKITNESEKEKTRQAEEGRKSRKASSEAIVIDLEKEQINLKRISSDEKESYSNRKKAIEDFYILQAQIENKKTKISLSTPNLTSGEIDKIKAENKKALTEIDDAESNEKKHLLEQQKQKMIAIEYDIFKSSIDRKKAFEQEMFNDDKRSTGERLAAYDAFSKNEKKLIDADYQHKIYQAGLIKDNQAEIQALEKEHQDKLTVTDMKGIIERRRLLESSLKSQLALANVNVEFGVNKTEIAALEKLNAEFKNGTIDAKEYEKQLKAIEEAARKTTFDGLKAGLEDTIAKMEAAGLDATNLKVQLQNLQKDNDLKTGDKEVKGQKERKDKRKQALDEMVSYEQDAANTISAIVDGQHELELNRIQTEIEANTKQKDVEIANINASSLSQQDKAAAVALATAQAQAREDALNKKKKDEQIKQAQFDKAIQAFNLGIKLIVDTADLNWIAVAADVAGLIELAAKPIPKYAEGAGVNGKPAHPGGPAIVGEGTKKERIDLPTGDSFIADHAMLLNLPADTMVTPLTSDDINTVMYHSMMMKTGQMLASSGNSDKKRDGDISRKLDTLNKSMNNVAKAIKESKPNITINNSNNSAWQAHIQNQVYH